MRKSDIAAVVGALVDSAPPLMLEVYRPDCCIAATRIGIEVLRFYGVEARPRVVEAMIFNPVVWSAIERGVTGEALQPSNLPGAWSVGVGLEGTPGRPGATAWNGHMLIEVPDVCLVDLALGQASRPERGQPLPPAAEFSWPEGWPEGQAFYPTKEGGMVTYWPKEKEYRQSPDWQRLPRALVGRIIRKVAVTLQNEALQRATGPAAGALNPNHKEES